MEILACFVIIGCTAFYGIYFSDVYKKRERLYFDFVSFCSAFSANLNFRQHTLVRLQTELSAGYGKHFNELFAVRIIGADDKKAASPLKLSATDMQYIDGFFAVLGKNDSAGQQQEVSFYKNYFEGRLALAQDECLKKVPMLQKIGVLAGVLLCILII